MNRAIYAGNGYRMALGTASGEPDAAGSKVIDATTGYTESVAVNGASNIRIIVDSVTGATGTVEVRYSTSKDFTDYEVAASLTIPAANSGMASFTDVTPIGFVRVYNLLNQNLNATIQQWF